MLRLTLLQDPNAKSSYTILCLGSHSDDIEIGCGGTILSLLESHKNLSLYWVVFSSSPQRKREALASAQLFLKRAGTKSVVIKNFKESFFPYVGEAIKKYFEELKTRVSPEVVFTHYGEDLHQDHRLISELTWNTYRDHLILEYEIPKYDGGLGSPNVFVPLDEAICQRKIEYILRSFKSQGKKPWFTEDTFRSILRLRGVESNSPSRHAEAFYCRKLVLS